MSSVTTIKLAPKAQRKLRKSKTKVVTFIKQNQIMPTTKEEIVVRQSDRRTMRSKKRSLRGVLRTDRFNMASMEEAIVALQHKPTTYAGMDFIRTAINPCGEDPNPDLIGIPDGSGTDSCLVKMRDDLLISPPTWYVVDSESKNWSAVIFSTPYLMSQLIIIRFDTADIPIQANVRDAVNAMTYAEWDASAYPSWHEPVMASNLIDGEVVEYDGPRFEITHLKPAALSAFSSLPTSSGWTYFRKWRTVYKGHTMHLNAPDLANQGRIISASTATESSIKNLGDQYDADLVNPIVAARYSVTPPFADNILAMQDVDARQDIFKKGSYSIQRHWNEAIIWNEAEDVRPIIRVSTSASTGLRYAVPDSSYFKVDGFDLNLGWIVDHVRGISSQAEIHIKHRVGISFSVPGTSPWAPFMTPCVPKDEGALNLYRELSSRLPHNYDSSFNDMGFLSGAINSVLGMFKGPLRSAIKMGAGFLHGLIGKGENYANSKVDKMSATTSEYGDRGFQ